MHHLLPTTLRPLLPTLLPLLFALGPSLLPATANAEELSHSLFIAGPTFTGILGEQGEVLWDSGKPAARDGYVLPNGNLLIAWAGEVRELTRDGQTVFHYSLSGRSGSRLTDPALEPAAPPTNSTADRGPAVRQEPDLRLTDPSSRSGSRLTDPALQNREIGTAQRLDTGRTLITELGPHPRLMEVNPDGSIALEFPLQPETDNAHMQTRMARRLPLAEPIPSDRYLPLAQPAPPDRQLPPRRTGDVSPPSSPSTLNPQPSTLPTTSPGHYLVPHLLAFAVKEYTPAGDVVGTLRTDLDEIGGRAAENWPFTAIRLPTGRTLVTLTHGNRVAEFDPDGRIAWQVSNDDFPTERPFNDPCGAQRLPNGNTVIASYAAKGDAIKVFEVTPDKKLVWTYTGPHRAHEIQVLTTNGKPIEGEPLK